MRSATYAALLASTASAQSLVTLLNGFMFQSTLTQIGAKSSTTTYKYDCPTNNAGITGIPEHLRPKPDGPTPTLKQRPTTTPKARLARQVPISAISSVEQIQSGVDDEPYYSFCEPFTIKQGPSTWEFHIKDPAPSAWTLDGNCKWKGVVTAADLTCTFSQSGYAVRSFGHFDSYTTTIPQKEAATDGSFMAVVVLSGSGAPVASQTPTGSAGASGGSALSGSSFASGSAGVSAAQSTGLAAAAPLPTGAIAFVGGAAGILAAALAL